MTVTPDVARRMFELVEPIPLVNFFSDEPNDAMTELGFDGYWDGYFAGRSAPLGRVSAGVVFAAFYNFTYPEVAWHLPSVWETTTPEAAIAARQRGCAAALRRILGDLADSPGVARAADLMTEAAASAPREGRVLFSALRELPVPEEPVARLWHSADVLREHRGDGHIVALVSEGIGGTEAHMLAALEMGMPAHKFGRIHHRPRPELDRHLAGLRERGLVDADGWFTEAGRKTKARIEALTDELAMPPYAGLSNTALDQLIADLEPLSARLAASGSS